MAVKSSERLQLVLKLATMKQQRAAEQLAAASAEQQQCLQQVEQLQSYQHEYSTNFSGRPPATALELRNYQRFYGNLEQVVTGQQSRIEGVEQQLDQARQLWQQAYGREKNLEKLVSKKQLQELAEVDLKLQRELDDRPRAQGLGVSGGGLEGSE